jgi:hypothetical protein
MAELSDINEQFFYLNPARWSGFSGASEDLIFGAGELDPAVPANWKSPSTQVVADVGHFQYLFDYTSNPGSATYIGTQSIMVECEAITTLKATVSNVEARIQWALNGAPSDTRYVVDNIAGANTSALLPASRRFEMVTGDYLDVYFNVDKACTLTITKAEWETIAVATHYE